MSSRGIVYRVITDIDPVEEYEGKLHPNLFDGTPALVNGFLVADVTDMKFAPDLVVKRNPLIMKMLRWHDILAPVFRLGEILLVDPEGIEYGLQRKTYKWSVRWEDFDTAEEAISRSVDILCLDPLDSGRTI